jgi:hypothetical protein
MNTQRFALLMILSAVAILPAAAQDLGQLTYLDGDIGVVRNGEALESSSVQIGLGIENFDLVKAGPGASAEIQISPQVAPRMTVSVSENTQFTFELSKIGKKAQGTIGLISGSLGLKMSKLAASQGIAVKTESTLMSVRGTSFSVEAPASGDVLVTCDEGEVVCTDESGQNVSALPGAVIEKASAQRMRKLAVAAGDLPAFRKRWVGERLAAFRTGALPAIRANAALYEKLRADLVRDDTELLAKGAFISRWSQEHRARKIGSRAQVEKEKKQIAAILKRLRATLFRLERVYYRLEQLERLHAAGFGKGEVSPGLSTDEFFQRLALERRDTEARMARVRFVAKLYTERDGGTAP